jgi:hypothetical protein
MGMATTTKDFKVKHGLSVTNGGSFGGTVVVATPTESTHAATKGYVDTKEPNVPRAASAPADPVDGQLYYDTVYNRLHIFYNSSWRAFANVADAEFLQEHIHDTSIGGNGLLASIFVEAGSYNAEGSLIETSTYNTTLFSQVWDGGISMDNFN